MRCFKTFFKHTWHPQQMDNPARFNSPSRPCESQRSTTTTTTTSTTETELGELKSVVSEPGIARVSGVPCYNGACKSSANGVKGRPEHRLESPWHYLKTLFLVSMIVALLVWIIVYVLLTQYDVL